MTIVALPSAAPIGALARFDAWLGRRVSMRSLALLRVFVGPIALLHLRPFLTAARHGAIYRDHFHEPYAAWYPELPRGMYVALLWTGVVAAVAMTIGLATRLATVTTFAVVTYNVFLSTTHFHNNRAYLMIVLAALAVVPCGRELSVDAWWRSRAGRAPLDLTSPAWPLWLLRFEAATVYGASGLSKLLDRDWRDGTVTWHRLVLVRDRLSASPLPEWAVTVLTDRSFHTMAAKVIVATELFIAAGLCWRASRLAAVWVAVAFHVAIQLSASVEVFSYLAIAALVIWAVPSTRDRVLMIDTTDSRHRSFAAAVRAFDWLARFDISVGPPGSPLRVDDRDGTARTGRPAVVFVLSRLPITAWFALPVLLVPGVRRSRHVRGNVGDDRDRDGLALVSRWTVTPGGRVGLAVASLAIAGVLAFGAVAPPERCPPVTADGLRDAAGDVVDWFARNQNPDGSWLYLYDAPSDAIVDDYNEVRHAGAVMGLYMAAKHGIGGAFALAEHGLEWSVAQLVDGDDWTAAGTAGQPSVGATALLLAGLTERRDQSGDERHDALMARLGRFLTAQTEPSGAVLSRYDVAAGAPVAGTYSKYYTGEAYWALAAMDRLFPDGPWGEVADRIGAYLATARDDNEGYWPRLADHWAAYGLAETAASGDRTHDRPLTDDEIAYARQQARLFGAQVRWISQQAGPWGSLVRGTFVPRGGGYGVIGEGLTGLWRVAGAETQLADVRDVIGARAMCIAGLALRAQSDAGEAADFPAPDRVQGAWLRDGETRMDDQQHALAALLRTIAIAEDEQPASPDGTDAAPSAWLWLLALVAAFSPARVALGVPPSTERTDRRRERATIAALGAAAGSLIVLLAAAASDALLDALDVSAASFRLAAGVVGVVAGAVAVFGRRPRGEPALPGRRAALVPVAVPLVANAALVVLAIGAAADRGMPIVTAAAAAGTLLTIVAALEPAEGTAARLLAAAARATGILLVLTGALLVVDGVFAI